MSDRPTENPLTLLSRHLAEIVARCAPSVVAVAGRGRRSSSGFVWRSGVVVTASDALERDEDIAVLTSRGERVAATLAGRDPSTDIAVLKVPEAGHPLGSAREDEASAGQLALTIGRHPDGPMASLGLIAIAGGPWQSLRGGRIDRRIGLDRGIDPRQEGGVVVNAEGGLIGMAVPGPRRSGLAIPFPTIERVAAQILAHGRVPRGYLGLGLQPVRLGDTHPGSRGLMVVSVDPNGPGRRAGMLIGDVMISWNGEPLRSVRDVFGRLGSEAVGQQISFSIVRAGQAASASIEISDRPT
jgi:S1-C subfamily serine protease